MIDTNPVMFEAAVPVLSVNNLSEALDYYQRVLGFHIGWQWGEPIHLASVCRDKVEVNLRQTSNGASSSSKVYFQMTGIDSYYSHIVTAGATVAVPLADRPYGMRDCRIVDPSGNELSFGEAMVGSSTD